MSASLPFLSLLRSLVHAFAVEAANEADRRNIDAASRHGRTIPSPVDVEKFLPKPLPIAFGADGSVRFDAENDWGHTLAMGGTEGGAVDPEACALAAGRCIATARMLLEKAGQR